MEINELAENHGTLDLLTAYIMRTVNVDEDVAADWVTDIDFEIERLLKERRNERFMRYICSECGADFVLDSMEDNEELLWGHIQMNHPEVFEEVQDLETPFMIETCYDTEELED